MNIKKALLADPHFSEAHYTLGNILRDKGQIDDAISCYERAIQLEPSNAYAWNNLGLV